MTEADNDKNKIPNASKVASNKNRTLTQDELFHLLQNERRRLVLRHLAETDGPVELRGMSNQVTAWECGTTVQQITSDQRQRVYISLYQNHLPKLADSGLITYNQSHGIVERTSLADQATRYLDRVDTANQSVDTESKWLEYYAGVTAFSALLIGVVWVGFGSIPSLSNIGLILIILLLYASGTVAMAADDGRISLLQPITAWSSHVRSIEFP